MTKVDYFAGQIVNGILAKGAVSRHNLDIERIFDLAEVMTKESDERAKVRIDKMRSQRENHDS